MADRVKKSARERADYMRDWRLQRIATGFCERCSEKQAPTSKRYCRRHLFGRRLKRPGPIKPDVAPSQAPVHQHIPTFTAPLAGLLAWTVRGAVVRR